MSPAEQDPGIAQDVEQIVSRGYKDKIRGQSTLKPLISGITIEKAGEESIIITGDDEMRRLTINHEVSKLAWPPRDFVQAPVDLSSGGKRIFDLAGVNGAWMTDFRSVYPGHEYVVTDIHEPYFPETYPSDMSFIKQDMNLDFPSDWTNTFDLVHSRMCLGAAQDKPMKDVFLRLIRILKPGGWLQMEEMEFQSGFKGSPSWIKFARAMKVMIGMMNGSDDLDMRGLIRTWMEEAGLVNIGVKFINVPVGKAIANHDPKLATLSSEALLKVVGQFIAGAKKMEPEGGRLFTKQDYQTLEVDLAKELEEEESWFPYFCLYGQKLAA